jgi:hypothetical protein
MSFYETCREGQSIRGLSSPAKQPVRVVNDIKR